jgi:hypothetical protein
MRSPLALVSNSALSISLSAAFAAPLTTADSSVSGAVNATGESSCRLVSAACQASTPPRSGDGATSDVAVPTLLQQPELWGLGFCLSALGMPLLFLLDAARCELCFVMLKNVSNQAAIKRNSPFKICLALRALLNKFGGESCFEFTESD